MQHQLKRSYHAATLAVVASGLLALISVRWGFVLTSASDPLEYVGPALNPEMGFPYPDRLALWLWLRAFALISMPVEWVGPVATLTQFLLIQFVAVFWLAKRVSLGAGAIFGTLLLCAPAATSIATYTYPMQLMTLLLLLAGIALGELEGRPRWITVGCLIAAASLAKLQAIGIVLLLVVHSIGRRFDWRSCLWLGVGGGIGVVLIVGIITLLDGPQQISTTIDRFLNAGYAARQYAGRAAGTLPRFESFLADPASILALGGAGLAWLAGDGRAKIFAKFSAIQIISLISIYLITARGGDLITNYFLDAQVFGLIAFAIVVGAKIRSGVFAGIAMLFLGFFAAEGGAALGVPAQYQVATVPTWLWSGLGVVQDILWLLLMAGCMAVAASTHATHKRALHVLATACFSAIFVMALLFAGKGPLHAKRDEQWSAPYHDTAKAIMSAEPLDCVEIIEGTDLERWRVLWLLQDLYRWPGVAQCGAWEFPL